MTQLRRPSDTGSAISINSADVSNTNGNAYVDAAAGGGLMDGHVPHMICKLQIPGLACSRRHDVWRRRPQMPPHYHIHMSEILSSHELL